jgi:endonuclease YncB( thermonuclease family)
MYSRIMIQLFTLAIVLFVTGYAASAAEAIVGRASVIDGDTLEIHGARIRLYGIDAPERGQSCTVQGKSSRCGQLAALALSDKIGTRPIACDPRDRDRYNRIVAVCRSDGEDINAWMVAQGWALAYRQYSTDYVKHEQRASASKLGIWQGEFVAPWEWRAATRVRR